MDGEKVDEIKPMLERTKGTQQKSVEPRLQVKKEGRGHIYFI
jgi:hypothetical protein